MTTTLSGGGTYSGSYRVLGDLLLTNGTYTLTPGTTFYVDGKATKTQQLNGSYQRQVTGATITVGVNASLVLDGATMTAAGSTVTCPMWRGVVLNNNGQGPSSPYRLIVRNNSTISHALCAIYMNDNFGQYYLGNSTYLIDQSTFAHNLTHIRDNTYHTSGQPSLITNCTFDSDAAQTHFPYNQTSASDKYYTYEALNLSPTGDVFSNAIEVRNNTISQAVYGIVNNMFDRAGVLIEGNFIDKVFQTGIWTVNNDSYSGPRIPVTSGNIIGMNVSSQNTTQIDPVATRYGIVAEGPSAPHHNAFVGNTITGTSYAGQMEVGMSIYGQTDVSGNLLQNLTEGISAADMDGSEIVDNRITGCTSGFVVKAYSNGMSQINRLGCNTFSQGYGGTTGNTTGIIVQQDAAINDIGSFSSPAANRFDGMTVGIKNNSTAQVTYYRTTSSQEAVSTGGLGIITVNTVGGLNLSNYCLGQGAGSGNGVNQYRGIAPSASYLAALMDSVRRQLVSPARYRSYLYEVVSYHASTQQLPALETWWATLAGPNAAAYRTVGRYLLGSYDLQQATAAAQRIAIGLQPQALRNAELAAQLRLRTVVRHLPQTTPLLAADSVVLRTLAWSGTSVADQATRWLRYFHPRIAVPAPALATSRLAAAARQAVLAESGARLGAAYPNPAQAEVTIACQLAQADQAAELRFTNLLTGQVALVVPVAGTGTERSQRVALAGLPAGQYAYQLVVEGQLASAPQKLFVNP